MQPDVEKRLLAIPEEVKRLPNWVVTNEGKAPAYPDTGLPMEGWNLHENHMPFAEAVKAWDRNKKKIDWIGFVLREGEGITIIDFDHCIDSEGRVKANVMWWVKKLGTYAEYSRSNEGIHLVALSGYQCKTAKIADKTHPWHGRIEMYDRNHMLILTGKAIAGYEKVEECEELVEELYEKTIGTSARMPAPSPNRKRSENPDEKYEELLKWISCPLATYDEWLAVLMGLHYEGVSFEVANNWCATDRQRYDGSDKLRKKWDSISDSGSHPITGGTLVAMAKAEGWVPVKPKAKPIKKGEREKTKKKEPELNSTLTEVSHAKRIARKFGEIIKYDDSQSDFYLWDDRIWEKLPSPTRIVPLIEQLPEILAQEANGLNLEKEGKVAYQEESGKVQQKRTIDNIISLIKPEPQIYSDLKRFDSKPYLINLKNGTYDLESQRFREHAREDMLTVVSNAAYDQKAKCPMWLSTLEKFLPDTDVRDFIQVWMGYCITGSAAEKNFALFCGTGENGKSTIINTVMDILGAGYAREANRHLFFEDSRHTPLWTR